MSFATCSLGIVAESILALWCARTSAHARSTANVPIRAEALHWTSAAKWRAAVLRGNA